jgi:hypothetical protein
MRGGGGGGGGGCCWYTVPGAAIDIIESFELVSHFTVSNIFVVDAPARLEVTEYLQQKAYMRVNTESAFSAFSTTLQPNLS